LKIFLLALGVSDKSKGSGVFVDRLSARAFSSSPGLLSWSVELCSLKGYRFGEDLRIAHA
jgi:hypothetical protein